MECGQFGFSRDIVSCETVPRGVKPRYFVTSPLIRAQKVQFRVSRKKDRSDFKVAPVSEQSCQYETIREAEQRDVVSKARVPGGSEIGELQVMHTTSPVILGFRSHENWTPLIVHNITKYSNIEEPCLHILVFEWFVITKCFGFGTVDHRSTVGLRIV